MLKSDTTRDELNALRSKQLTAREIRFFYSDSGNMCCKEQCIFSLIHSKNKNNTNRRTCNATSSNSNNSGEKDSYMFCQQIGIATDSIPSHDFDRFVEEVRQPFLAFKAGSKSDAETSSQLRYYLVQKFQESRKSDSLQKQNQSYVYQLFSLSRGPTEVCKTAYIILTGVSVTAIDYAQRLVRNDVSAESLILKNSDQQTAASQSKAESLKSAFDLFRLDYNLYAQNINNYVDITKIPDSTAGFLCVTFLAEWFELAGEQEAIIYLNHFQLRIYF